MVPQTVVYFTAYDQLKLKFGYVSGEQNVIPSLSAGVSARGKCYICYRLLKKIVLLYF